MKVLRGTLTFVLGMIVGIILFVVAIGGTLVALAMAVKVGDLQAKFTDQEIVSSDSDLYDQTLYEAVQSAIGDFQNFDQLSLKTLYDHYGISVLQGVGGIDFTNKAFYTAPISSIMGDFSIIVNSFTLRDISGLTGNDFGSYNLPILTDNLDNNIQTALDNILGSIQGDLTIRTIKTNLIPDFNIENDMIKAMQDIKFSSFGSAINAFKLCTFLSIDTDTFVPSGAVRVYVKSDRYEAVSAADLKNTSYVAPDGVELFSADVNEETVDGKTEYTLIQKELRYVNKGTAEEPNYVVDNSCYNEDFNADETTKSFYRHFEYEPYHAGTTYPAETEFFVKGYGNRVTAWDNDETPATYELYFKGYVSLKDLYVEESGDLVPLNNKVTGITINASASGYKDKDDHYVAAQAYTVKDEPIKKSSKLVKKDFESTRSTYFRVHEGTSSSLMQSFAYLSISELQDMDDFVKTVTIGDVITITDSSSSILKALKDTSLNDLSDKIDTLSIDEVMTIVYDKYTEAGDGTLVYVESTGENYVLYNENRHSGMTRYRRDGDEGSYSYTVDNDGKYVKNGYFTKYVEAEHGVSATKYKKDDTITDASSLIMQALALRGAKTNELGKITDQLFVYEVVDMAADDTSKVMKALAKRDCTIKGIGSAIDELYIDEVIDIDESSSSVMKSLAKRKCKIKDLGKITDDLSLAESMNIVMDTFEEDVNGVFVCIEDPETYIPYEEAQHLGWNRFVKVGDAWVVYDESNPAHADLVQYVHGRYYTLYNPAIHTEASYQFYRRIEVEGSSSKVLQRFANTTLGKFTDAFKTLILGDVLKIDADKYEVADSTYISAHPDEQYFHYDATDGVYLIANEKYRTDHASETFFHITKTGKDKKIIKKLAYAKVDNLSSAIDKIMDDMFLSDLIDIFEYYQVRLDTTGLYDDASKFLIYHDGEYKTEYVKYDADKHDPSNRYNYNDATGEYELDANGDYALDDVPVVFVHDGKGKYIKSPFKFTVATDAELGNATTGKYNYVSMNTAAFDPTDPSGRAAFAENKASGNLYYIDGGDPAIQNVSLCTYLYFKNERTNLYIRELDAGGTETYTKYDGADLYVKIMGKYIAYDDDNPAHDGLTIYHMTTSTEKEFFVRYDEYKDFHYSLDGESKGYYDEGGAYDVYEAGDRRFAMQYCEDIYVETDGTVGAYVFIDGKYVPYDSENTEHDGKQRTVKVLGFIANKNQAYYQIGSVDYSDIDPHLVEITQKKSSAVLRMMKKNGVTMKNMGEVVADATIDDLMDVEPNSIFDKKVIRDSTINTLGSKMSNLMNTMTIGELLDWANITTINPTVKASIENATLVTFFASMDADSSGVISINMKKLYGVD